MKNLFILICISLIIVFGTRELVARSLPHFSEGKPSLLLNKKMPAFDLSDVNGNKVSLSGLKGKVIVVNVFSTTCSICNLERPSLNNLAESYNNKNVVFLAFTIENNETLQVFLNKHPFSYTTVANSKKLINQDLGFHANPNHVIIDKKGTIRYFHAGFDIETIGEMKKKINELMGQ